MRTVITDGKYNIMNTLVFSNLSKLIQRKYLQIHHEMYALIHVPTRTGQTITHKT